MNFVTKMWVLLMLLAIVIVSDWTPTTARLNFGLVLTIVGTLVFTIDMYLYHR